MSPPEDSQSRVIALAITDPIFRKRLVADPTATLRAAGVQVSDDLEVRVVEDTANVVHLVLPAPIDDMMSDSALDAVAGGLLRTGGCVLPSGCLLNTG